MADQRDDFVSFDNALRELRLTEEQLKRLVSEGEIRAIRGDQNSMKFRREEIERLKQDTGKTIQYTEESSDTLTDDLLFDEADDLQVDDEGLATAQLSNEDTFVGSPADGTGMTTTPMGPPTRVARTPGAPAGKKSGGGAPSTAVRRTTGRSQSFRSDSIEAKATGIGMGMTALLIITFLVGAYAMMVWWDTARESVSAPVKGLTDFTVESFTDLGRK